MRYYFRIRGRVQGIGYRYFVRHSAQELNLTGWVRNCSNGDVELEVQGPEAVLNQFAASMENGHPWARIEHVAKEKLPDQSEGSERKEFDVKY